MTWYTHINRNVIDSNRKHGKNDPPIRVQKGKYGKPSYGYEVKLPPVSSIIYSNDGGARLVIVSEEQPEIVE